MESSFLIIVSAALSGLLATLITLWVQRKTRKYNSKFKIFETLMSHRYNFAAEDNVKALNSIDVIFYEDEKVLKAFEDFLNETVKAPETNPNHIDKYLKLLEEMADKLNLKNISWDCIKKHMYCPDLLFEKINEENALRKALLQNAVGASTMNSTQQNNVDQYLIVQELLKNPESLKLLIKHGLSLNARNNDVKK